MSAHANNVLIVNSLPAVAGACTRIKDLFAEHRYLVLSWKTGLDRTLEQNAKLWPMLTDIAKQVVWYGKTYDADGWKDILTGSLRKAEFVPNTEGTGFVAIGLRTSKMSRKQFSELIEFIYAFGASQDVCWSEKSEQAYQEYREGAA